MLLAVVSFIPQVEHEEGELVRAAQDYLTALIKNGQIHDQLVTGWVDGIYSAYVHLAHRDAWKDDVASIHVRQASQVVALQFGIAPEWHVLDDETSLPVPQLSSAGFLYLMSHAFHSGSPVWHGQRGTCLPMSLLPITSRLKEDLYDWARQCRRYDEIWTIGGPLAVAAWQQLSTWTSEFNQEGKRLADELQLQTDTDCYVYLWNDFSIEDASPLDTSASSDADSLLTERQETACCPSCGIPWEIDQRQIPSREPFRKFHYRCQPCRIVTHEPQRPWGAPPETMNISSPQDSSSELKSQEDEATEATTGTEDNGQASKPPDAASNRTSDDQSDMHSVENLDAAGGLPSKTEDASPEA